MQIVLPIVVAIVTKASARPGVKAVVLLALTAVSQFVSSWIDAGITSFDWKFYAMNVSLGFAVAVAAHFGLWKPTGLSGNASNIGPQ